MKRFIIWKRNDMHINEVISWFDDFSKMDAAIAETVELLNNKPNRTISKKEIRNTLLLVGKKLRVKNIKKLFDRFHQKIRKGVVPPEYNFYSDIALSPTDPRMAGVTESFSEVGISYEDYDDDENGYDIDELIRKAEELSRTSSVNILRDKDLYSVLVDDSTGNVVGGLWTSFDGREFSFDVIIASKYQQSGLGKKLIDSGMDLFNQYEDAGAELNLHVTNPHLPKLLQREYGLKVKEKHPDGTVSMGN